MFTVDERTQLRDALVAAARADPRIGGAAITGSASLGREDAWSDIDLALSVTGNEAEVVGDWTRRMYDAGAVHHVDLVRAGTRFRVFLLATTLQVDIAFWPDAEFGPTAPTFRLLFGSARDPRSLPGPSPVELIGMGWLYALHARSAIARGRVLQAEHMISAMRDEVLALACLRHGLPAAHARGADDLPPSEAVPRGLVRTLDRPELLRASGVVTEALIGEVQVVDPGLAARLSGPLRAMAAGTD